MHVTRAIEVGAPVEAVHAEWLRFEEQPRCAVHVLTAGIRWRAEVLTLEPLGERTRVKLRVEYEPMGSADVRLPWKIEALLLAFLAFREREAGAESAAPAG